MTKRQWGVITAKTSGREPIQPELLRVSRMQLASLVNKEPEAVDSRQRDEMAIPSYLHWNPLIRWLMWCRYAAILEHGDFRANHTVFEFGCGTGIFLPTLASCTRSVVACDLFPQYAKGLCAALSLNVEFVDPAASLGHQQFDRVIAADVLEHVHDPLRELLRFADVLKPGGRLLISGPTENHVYQLGRIAAGFAGKGDYHKRNIDDIRRLAEKAGYRSVDVVGLPFSTPPHLFRLCAFEA